MTAARASRRNSAAPDAAAAEARAIDTADLEDIAALLVKLAAGNRAEREASEILRENYNNWIGRIAMRENSQGHSAGDEVKTDQRNRLLHQLHATMTAAKIRRELLHYQSTSWPRDRQATNPYPDYDQRFLFYRILMAKDHVPGESHMRAILRSKGV